MVHLVFFEDRFVRFEQAGVPFFSISASEFVEIFAGIGASRVRDLFEQAVWIGVSQRLPVCANPGETCRVGVRIPRFQRQPVENCEGELGGR